MEWTHDQQERVITRLLMNPTKKNAPDDDVERLEAPSVPAADGAAPEGAAAAGVTADGTATDGALEGAAPAAAAPAAAADAAADGAAAHALVTTQVATATAVIVWICLEWILRGKASVLGAASGAVAGLVAITPAAGFVPAWAAFLVGAGGSFGAYWGVTALKKALKVDDTLDAFGLHGVGGLVGAILTGVFASEAIGGTPGAIEGNLLQVWTQAWGALAAAAYCGVVTFIILFVQSKLMTLRVDEESEVSGLDTSLHGESVGS